MNELAYKFFNNSDDCYLIGDYLPLFMNFYNDQINLNQINQNYLLPSYRNNYNEEFIYPGDEFVYNLDKGFVFKKIYFKENYKDVQNHFEKDYLLFLGTGGSLPTKNKTVSSILMKKDEDCMLFDVGEDTINQILRLYGNLDILDNLKFVFLSHSHADHMLGLCSILRHVSHRNQSITIFGSEKIRQYCDLFSRNYKFIYANPSTSKTFENYTLEFSKCQHYDDSVYLKLAYNGKIITYSGDTRPSFEFVNLSHNANYMIHECTYLYDENEEAFNYNHSTILEAIDDFKQSKAKILFLTHFSQRYKIDDYLKLIDEKNENISIASDMFIYFLTK
ncbi:RNZ [Hepatospora eriocheir]|uniref:ribonuclease Z n=1 Tax=Hepatospora eriocheir TaxID=1081669 RepID=A0A1X0Q9T8_9MICR|nr:RNZ [Hepatospora eriocheir]